MGSCINTCNKLATGGNPSISTTTVSHSGLGMRRVTSAVGLEVPCTVSPILGRQVQGEGKCPGFRGCDEEALCLALSSTTFS